jgi:MFS family permease
MNSSANFSSKSVAATIALIGFAYFVIAVVALYFLNPAYDLISSFEGNYDLASYEFLIASTFFGLGLGSIALMIGLYQTTSRSVGSWISFLLLGIWSVGILLGGIFPANEGGSTVPHLTTAFIAGIFPVEVEAYPETTLSFIHILAIFGALFSLSLAAILLSWRFKHEEKWRSIRYFSFILALAMIAASIFICQAMFLFIHTEIVGLSLRLLTFSSLLWLVLMVTHLRFAVVEFVSKR